MTSLLQCYLRKEIKCLYALGILFSCFAVTKVSAQGDLLITPKRIVFEGKTRMQELSLANIGTDTAKFMVSFLEIRMKEDGSFEQITTPDPDQYFASTYLRFFPRSVVLAPGEGQVVKVQLAKTGDMPEGEYRSHIYFRGVPNDKALGEKTDVKDSAGVYVRLTPVFGITIPVIIRVGNTSARVDITELSLVKDKDTPPRLKMVFVRSGNASVYGDLIVEHISPEGKVSTVATVNGVAVYTPNTIRHFYAELDTKQQIDYEHGKLRVVFSEKTDMATNRLAEAEISSLSVEAVPAKPLLNL